MTLSATFQISSYIIILVILIVVFGDTESLSNSQTYISFVDGLDLKPDLEPDLKLETSESVDDGFSQFWGGFDIDILRKVKDHKKYGLIATSDENSSENVKTTKSPVRAPETTQRTTTITTTTTSTTTSTKSAILTTTANINS